MVSFNSLIFCTRKNFCNCFMCMIKLIIAILLWSSIYFPGVLFALNNLILAVFFKSWRFSLGYLLYETDQLSCFLYEMSASKFHSPIKRKGTSSRTRHKLAIFWNKKKTFCGWKTVLKLHVRTFKHQLYKLQTSKSLDASYVCFVLSVLLRILLAFRCANAEKGPQKQNIDKVLFSFNITYSILKLMDCRIYV